MVCWLKMNFCKLLIRISPMIFLMSINTSSAALSHSAPFVLFSSLPDTVPHQINPDMLRMFQEFKERGTISETLFFRVIEMDDRQDSERWRQLLEEYRGAIAIGEDPLEQPEFLELVTEEIETYIQEQVAEPTDTPATIVDPTPVDIVTPQPAEIPVAREPDRLPALTSGSQDIVRYHIQIAASTQPLDNQYLRRLYSGDLKIEHFREDPWEKYYAGEFYSFAQAREELRQTKVQGAFIIGFVLDQKLIAYRARQVERVFSQTKLNTFHNDPENKLRVQIAASKKPMTQSELTHIYPQTEKVGIIFEEGWYKYSIPGANSLSDSWRIARETNVTGAFVVRYQKGKRLPLR
jgi:hypothetical protein